MKAILQTLLLLGALVTGGAAQITLTPVNVGSAANDGTGDSLRGGFIKINTNFYKLNAGKLDATNGVAYGLSLRGSTNAFVFTNGAVAGYVLTTDGTNWFAAAPTGSGGGITNLPSYALTNNDTKTISFAGPVTMTGPFTMEAVTTNGQVVYFKDDIYQTAGNTAEFPNLNVATSLIIGGTSFYTHISTTSNDLYSAIVASGISANTATNIARYFATNSALVTSNQLINLLSTKTNPTIYGTVTLPGVTASEVAAFDGSKGLTTVSGISATELGFVDNLTENVQDAINELRSSQARVGDWVASITNTILLNTSSNYVAVISNAANNTRIRLASGTYTVTPSKVLSNGLGAINLLNKTNLIIEAEEGAIIDGSSAIGELLWATNCDGLVIRGLTFKGAVITNYVLVSNIGHVWGGVSYHNVRNFSFERNRVIDHHDHGTLDMGSQGGNWSPSTNNVWIERNYFSNIGSARTNDPVIIDGGAIVPSGGVIQFNEIENSLRGIEPYIDLNTTRLSPGVIVRGNVIRNTLEHGILVAGSTNMHDLIIEDNRITWDLGYTRRGSNVIKSADGININGGQRATIRNNTILNAPNFDINTTSDLEKFGFIIEGNKGRGSFYTGSGGGGIELSASSAQYPSRGFVVRNNTIENKRSYGFSANGIRDARFNGNTLINVGTNGTMAVWVYAGGGQLNSNVIFEATSITGDERAAKAANGFQVESGNKEVSIAGSQIKGITTPISNSAGAEVVTLEYSRTSTNAVVVNWELVRASNTLHTAKQATNAVLGNLIGTVANNVTNENSSALQINNGTLTLSPGVLSNIVQTGFGAPYIAISTNSGTLNNITSLVARSGIVVSNDSTGIASLHVSASSGGGGTNFPPVISITTNVTVGSGVRQSVTMLTASNQFLNFQGTALNGETVEVAVTNSASTNIQIALNAGGSATTFWNPLVASNDTRFAVPAGTMRIVEFKYSTNNGARWRLNDDIGFTYEIAPGSNITLTTNAGTITIASTGGSAGLSFLGDWWANNVVSNIVGGTLTTNKMNIGGGGGVTGGSINNQARLIPYGGTIRGLIANAGGTFTAGNILFEVFTNDVSTGINLSLASPYTNATANVNLVAGSFVDIRQSASTNLTPTGTIEVSAQLILQLNP